ncbi:uncharacterized protein C2845_PMPSC055828 [Panicum miliaceum]|uniref:Uncharacterized protein n=1 Tax=Panicum miliaceum TaxID=4540 RepID=A0A3L6PBM8_PANMI|nr:uncharacterized protein C2845_PMPSC055828 [Panicum miliaceum]
MCCVNHDTNVLSMLSALFVSVDLALAGSPSSAKLRLADYKMINARARCHRVQILCGDGWFCFGYSQVLKAENPKTLAEITTRKLFVTFVLQVNNELLLWYVNLVIIRVPHLAYLSAAQTTANQVSFATTGGVAHHPFDKTSPPKAIQIVGSKLAPLLIKEYSLIVGVQKHLEELNDQVQEINCWLEAVGDEVARNGPALNWLRKLKDIAYGVDDIVDEFQLEAESYDAHGVGGVVSNYLCAKPKSLILQCKAASKLKAVKKRFDGIVKQRTEFSTIANSLLASDPVRDMNHNTANMTSLPIVDVASVLGRDQEKNQIISKLAQNVPPKNMFQKARSIYVDNCADAIFGALKDTRHLRSITVGTRYMQAIPIAILQVKNLKYLVISRLRCKALPEAISDIWSLQALYVTFSDIVELPKSIGKLKKLRKLNLFWCRKLKCLPDSIGDCQMVSSIDLRKCEVVRVLPESIGRMEKLRVLGLGQTKIERLPSGITALRNLERLYLDRCRELVELPEGIGNLEKLQVLDLEGCVNLRGMPVGIGQLSRLQKLDLFVVGEGEKFAAISELGNVCRNSEDLTIRGIEHATEPDDAHKACLKQKANLQRLELRWRMRVGHEENTKLEQAVLDGLEPPPGIKGLEIVGYSGRECARWMQNQVGGGVQRLSYFPYLRVMHLHNFPNLKHLDGLAELPCLEELELKYLASLESISGGPFPSLVKLVMWHLPSLGEVWMVAEKSMPDGCSNCTPHLGQVLQVGSCVSNLDICGCPMLEVKPYLPLSLQHLDLSRSNGQLLQSPCACSGYSSFSGFSHLKKLELWNITGCGRGWELLQHMTALESLLIRDSEEELTELPECFRSLKSLQSLEVSGCSAVLMLPEWLGELRSLRELTIMRCKRLSSLPQSVVRLTSLQNPAMHFTNCPNGWESSALFAYSALKGCGG